MTTKPEDLTAAECGYDEEDWDQLPDETREQIQADTYKALEA